MGDLKQRFGHLVAAHRRRLGWTQRKLAEAADLNEDTIGRIEIGRRGVSFNTIEKLAVALQIDPAELFTSELPGGALHGTSSDVAARLAGLGPDDVAWISGILDAALKPRR
jgi:transcriptional regulator with XRE-family HTH domain